MEAYWHEVALGAISMIILLAGVVWTMTTKRLERMSNDMRDMTKALTLHVASDTAQFSRIRERMDEHHMEILRRINGRWGDSDSGLRPR